MVEYKLGIYANPHAPKSIIERAAGMLWLLPAGHSFCDIIPPTHSRWQAFPKKIIVAGGDGSVREICQWMHDRREEVRPVGLLPGGSQNVLYNALRKLDLKSDAKTFLEKTLDDYPEGKRLRSGMINDRVFMNHVGLGHFEQHLGRFNARLRFLPNGYRPLICAFLALAAAALSPNRKEDILNLYTITPTIGKVPAFPDQRLLSDKITHAWVEGIGGFARTLYYWQRGKPAPKGAMRQFQNFGFADNVMGGSVWIDGDTIPYNLQGALIKRTPYGIPMVAII